MIMIFFLEEKVVLIVVFVHFVYKFKKCLVDKQGLVDQNSNYCLMEYYKNVFGFG